MGKLFSWVLIAFAIYVAYKVMLALQRKSALRESARDQSKGAAGGAGKSSQAEHNPAAGGALVQLVSCAHCGLQLPREDALSREPRYFCGEAHARLGATERDGH